MNYLATSEAIFVNDFNMFCKLCKMQGPREHDISKDDGRGASRTQNRGRGYSSHDNIEEYCENLSRMARIESSKGNKNVYYAAWDWGERNYKHLLCCTSDGFLYIYERDLRFVRFYPAWLISLIRRSLLRATEDEYFTRAQGAYIPMCTSPSHFFSDYFTQALVIDRHYRESGRYNTNFLIPRLATWQHEILRLFDLYSNMSECEIPTLQYLANKRVARELCFSMNNELVLSSPPLHEGLHQSMHALKTIQPKESYCSGSKPARIYLTRFFHDCFRSKAIERTSNYTEILRWCKRHNVYVACPERHGFWQLYSLLSSAKIVYADMGSSQIHALVNFDFIRNTNAMFVPFVGPSFFSLPFADTQIWDWYYNAVSSGILRVHEGIKIKDGDGRPGTESIRVCIDRLPLEP